MQCSWMVQCTVLGYHSGTMGRHHSYLPTSLPPPLPLPILPLPPPILAPPTSSLPPPLPHFHACPPLQVKDDSGVYETILIAPSVTPFVDQNPSYRIFEMDPNTYKLLDFQQYHMNLTKANGRAAWGSATRRVCLNHKLTSTYVCRDTC